jgi:hypothetical protein
MEAYGAGPAYDVAPVEATHQTRVACSGFSSTPSSGSRPFWSSVYNKAKAGTTQSTASAVAT